jgi:hypothetical protein
VSGGWTRLHNLYASRNIIKLIKSRKTGYVACVREMRNSYKILVRKPEGKRPLRKPRCRQEPNIRETGWEVVDWIHLAKDTDQWQAFVNMVMNLQVS